MFLIPTASSSGWLLSVGGPPDEQPDVYRERSPLFQVDRLRIPLLVHVARNDEDVNIEEDLPLVNALRSHKPALAVTKVYDHPPGGHVFDRRVNARTWEPENTPEQQDSWKRVWRFLGTALTVPEAGR
jgi:dipeptidyl aminopeptidase/acylaminoacyl peptidase